MRDGVDALQLGERRRVDVLSRQHGGRIEDGTGGDHPRNALDLPAQSLDVVELAVAEQLITVRCALPL